MDAMVKDLSYVLRSLRKAPGFVATSLLTLTLGIAASTTVFSAVDTVVFRPLPYPQSENLVTLMDMTSGGAYDVFSQETLDVWKHQSRSFERMAGFQDASFVFSSGEIPEVITGAYVEPDLFAVLGVDAAVGRVLSASVDLPGTQPAVVISNSMWRSRFSADEAVIQQHIELNGLSYAIVGVMPEDFGYPMNANVWLPETAMPLQPDRQSHLYRGVARLAHGRTVQDAQSELYLLDNRRRSDEDGSAPSRRAVVSSLEQQLRGGTESFWVFATGVAAVFLIACVNMMILFLLRGIERSREFAVRRALGASRWRITRQLILECLVLSACGAAGGVVLTNMGVELAEVWLSNIMELPVPMQVNLHVLLFATSVAFIAGTVVGLAPTFQIHGLDVRRLLQEGGGAITGGHRGFSLRRLLAAAEVSLTLVLVTSAGLLAKSYLYLNEFDLGFAVDKLTTINLRLRGTSYEDEAQARLLANQLSERLERLGAPGAVSVWSAFRTRTGVKTNEDPITLEYETSPLSYEDFPIESFDGTASFFETVGLPITVGRGFTDSDTHNSIPVAVVNELAAERLWPGENPLGRRFRLESTWASGEWLTVVGVAENSYPIEDAGLFVAAYSQRLWPLMFRPLAQTQPQNITVGVRTDRSPPGTAATIQARIQELAPGIVVEQNAPMRDLLFSGGAFPDVRLGRTLLSAFALFSLCLAVLGVYGVVAEGIRRRIPEIGIRRALGAQNAHVARVVAREVVWLGVVGLACGVVSSVVITRALRHLLFGTGAVNPTAFLLAVVTISVAIAVACYLPLRHAVRVDPMVALRHE